MNIPFPHSYIFPSPVDGNATSSSDEIDHDIYSSQIVDETFVHKKDDRTQACSVASGESVEESSSLNDETVWVEGLIPGIDFCNHGRFNILEL